MSAGTGTGGDWAAQAFSARVQRTFEQALGCLPNANPQLEEHFKTLCVEAALAHYNGHGAVQAQADLREAVDNVTDVLQTNKPDLASLNRGEIGKDVLKV